MSLEFFLFFIPSFLGIIFYSKLALRYGIYAAPNYRSLHANTVPRGGGLVIALSCMLGLFYVWSQGLVVPLDFLVLISGSALAACIGFIDDAIDLNPLFRFFVQIVLGSLLSIYVVYNLNHRGGQSYSLWILIVLFSVFLFSAVWFFNLFNFIDGIDGQAGSVVVFIGGLAGSFLFLKGHVISATLFLILVSSTLSFLIFNWPPAKIFLGDSGTWFISYYLCFLMAYTILNNQLSVWIWLIMMAYCFSDTTLTTLTRLIRLPGSWYKPHRSHAYQNLARVWGSHLKVLGLVLGVHFLWLLPLAVAAWIFPTHAMWMTFLAYIPLCLFSLRFGPLYEDV